MSIVIRSYYRFYGIENTIKPANFLVEFNGDEPTLENLKLYLTDFGLVGDHGGGTPGFASPECISGTGINDENVPI